MLVRNNVHLLEATRKGIDYKGRKVSSMVYAVIQQDGITLIDSGFPSFAAEIMEELKQFDGNKELSRILLTHADLDHIGNAYDLQQSTGCKVYISGDELAYITNAKPRFGMKQKMCDDFNLKIPKLSKYENSRLGEFQIIPTPGHTEGHVSILYDDVLFPGDICSYSGDAFCGPNPLWTEDMGKANQSLSSLRDFRFSIVCPAHGAPFERNGYI